ncbi:MAG: AAA family ATPase, partial [Bacilli bacterium]|nr:AAA family ATPase [Bacilli bacterium]
VSCFTATAKQKVIEDIKKYFKEKLSLDLQLFRSGAQRTNLTYYVFSKTSEEDKYQQLRTLLETHDCPAIVYVSRTRRTKEIADRLNADGVIGQAVSYHGGMKTQERIDNQEKFMRGEIQTIVATTAFGMGVDKNDVGIVIHYDISSSLEDYVQEAGRAGRDENISAECFVLFNEEDLNKHFVLLNQTKLSIKEIQQVWKAIKEITKLRASASRSALEIAREAGWDDSIDDIEMRVKTAIAALEESGFMKRGQNAPRIFANSILVNNMEEAVKRINASSRFSDDKERQDAARIMKSLISSKSRAKADNDDGETRVDYLSERLGIAKGKVINVINHLREERILADAKDLIAFIKRNGRINLSLNILSDYRKIENTIIDMLSETEQKLNLKEINKACEVRVPNVNIQKIKTIFNFYAVKQLIKRKHSEMKDILIVKSDFTRADLLEKHKQRIELSDFIIRYLFKKSTRLQSKYSGEEIDVEFSCLEIKEEYENGNLLGNETSFEAIDDALYYLLKIGALRLDGAFLVTYNAMRIERMEQNTRRQYKKDDYKRLEDFYNNKVQQIHIVGEYAKRMTRDYHDALQFVDDYFKLNYDSFLRKYFRGREAEITNNITPKKFKQLFGDLSPSQLGIIKDANSKYIVVAAGPGSGKTKVLVHKLASLYMMEDVKHEQMLMLTFSRASANEFKKRLMSPTMLGNAAHFIQISTFHSYCFDLLGKVGSLDDTETIISEAVRQIKSGEIETNKITKTVLVIDEAQDMSETEFSLVQALMEVNEEMRIIAVGDDDQNIYEFRKSDSKYLINLIKDYNATKYELLDNYRSQKNIVALANDFLQKLSSRLKKEPIKAVRNTDGEVFITKYTSPNLSVP